MNTLKTIFYFEWQQLVRSKLMHWLLIIITACSLYAIYYGHKNISRQLLTINFLEKTNDSTKQSFQNYFKDKRVADSVRFGWANMNTLYDGFTTEDYLDNNVAINKPNRLSHLSIGQRDLYPIYRKVSARSLYYDGSGISLDDKYAETNNPHKLLAGNFDLSFVFLYLFPLLIIALCYNVLSQEKENGTFPILQTQPVSMLKIIGHKFLFRFLLVISLVVIYSVIGYLFTPVKDLYLPSSFFSWISLLIGYTSFWFALVFLIVSLKYSSSVSALVSVGCWMLFLIVIPSLINNYIAANYKISSRTKFVTELGEQMGSIWETNDSITLPVYYKTYPQYSSNPVKPLWTENDSYDSLGKNEEIDLRYNKKLILYHFILDQNIKTQLAIYNEQIIDKLTATERFAWINPVVTTQEAMNDIAASGYRYNQHFRSATAIYRDSIFNISNNFVFGEKKLTLADYKSYPTFTMKNTPSNKKELINALGLLLTLSGIFIGLALIKKI